MEESERSIQPRFAPPLPTETVTLTRARQMVPDLLFDPIADVREAPTRMADRKVLHPTPQNRVDFRNHYAEGQGTMAAEDLLERAQQRRPLFSPAGCEAASIGLADCESDGSHSQEVRSARLA
jgi:hypothetical protein